MTGILAFLALCTLTSTNAHDTKEAIVKVQGSGVDGVVRFKQEGAWVLIQGEITGLTPGQHGFHVHALGDLSKGCASAGSHFNPYNQAHGAPTAEKRHVGDLGNIIADQNGVAHIDFKDNVIALSGERSIVGRAVVVHAGVDDLGLGGNEESLKTGNAGARAGCGVIGILEEESNGTVSTNGNLLKILTLCIILYLIY